MQLTISKRFKSLLPILTAEEKEQLEANIVSAGRVREPLCVWRENGSLVIVDGMNRYEIATRLGLPFETTEMTFTSRDEAEIWMLRNQIGRRNMTADYMKRLSGELYNRLKRNDLGHGDQRSGGQNGRPKLAAEVVSEQTGRSPRTVRRDGAFVSAVESMVAPLRKLIEEGKIQVANSEAKTLAQQDPTVQTQVARNLRTGSDIREAMSKAGVVKKKADSSVRSDLGKCPNCAGTRWTPDGTGYACSKCHHPHGEPAGDVDTDRISVQRSKTVKTVEALMRAFDDLELLLSKPSQHASSLSYCKLLWQTAKGWK